MPYSFRSRVRLAAGAALVGLAGACTPAPEPAPTPAPAPVPAEAPAPLPPLPPPVAPPAATVPAELASAWNAYLAAWNGDDPVAVAAHFTDDAVVVVDDSTYTGRDAIRTRWIAPSLQEITRLGATPESFAPQGDEIAETGRYVLTATTEEGAETESGRYTHRWVRGSDGSWRIRAATVQD